MRLAAFAILLLIGCTSDKRSPTPPIAPGVFTTYKPGHMERVLLERKYSASVFPLPAAMLYFRQDGTYVFGFCDNQISQAGKFKVSGDSILLFDKYQVDNRMEATPGYIYYNKKEDLVLIVTTRKELDGKEGNRIIPLKRNQKYAHIGFLRGMDMDLTEIINDYQQHSVDQQNAWTDSVLQSTANTKQ